jgi:hypothetical protein
MLLAHTTVHGMQQLYQQIQPQHAAAASTGHAYARQLDLQLVPLVMTQALQ